MLDTGSAIIQICKTIIKGRQRERHIEAEVRQCVMPNSAKNAESVEWKLSNSRLIGINGDNLEIIKSFLGSFV